jgi:hypothetical protein
MGNDRIDMVISHIDMACLVTLKPAAPRLTLVVDPTERVLRPRVVQPVGKVLAPGAYTPPLFGSTNSLCVG